MGILEQCDNISGANRNNSKIPDYARDYRNEYLFIRGINKTCKKFVKILDLYLYLYLYLDLEGEIFKSPLANKPIFYFNKFLKSQELGYLKDISEFYFKEIDVNFIESLESQIDDYMDIFYDPDSNKFDQEKYENDNSGLKEFYESFSKFKDKIKIEEITFSDFKNSLNFLDSDSDSDDGIDSEDIDNILSDSD